MTNTCNTPVEALERSFPLRVLRYRLRRGSGAAGWSAGGEGIERDRRMLTPGGGGWADRLSGDSRCRNHVTVWNAVVCVAWRGVRSDQAEQWRAAQMNLSRIDAQMTSARTASEVPDVSHDAWPHLASEIRASVANLGEAGANRIRAALPQPPEDYATELSAFQGWIGVASRLADDPFVVRARVMTELYVSFVVVRDLLAAAAEAVPVDSPLAEVDRFLTSGRRDDLRRAVASGRWGYQPDFAGLRILHGHGDGDAAHNGDVSQGDLHAWQTLSRGAAIAILAALTE